MLKKLRVRRIKVICSKGRIERGDEVILTNDEYNSIIAMSPDAFDVLGDVAPEAPKKTVRKKPNVKYAH